MQATKEDQKMELTITENTKLSEIAALIETLPLGDRVKFTYHFGGQVFRKVVNSNRPIIEINVEVLKWMAACQG